MFVIPPPAHVQMALPSQHEALQSVVFTIGSAPPPAAPKLPPGPVLLTQPPPVVNEPDASAPVPPSLVRHFRLTTGYGDHVPLAFAVRQIVPHGVRVTYGAGVDPSAAVSWQGGREWNKVLATTVSPLGERINVGRAQVTILKK